MSDNIFDSNQLMMMINILSVYTRSLRDEVSDLKIEEIEERWKNLLSTLHNCFSYAQSNGVDLRNYKTELKEIVDNLHVVEKLIRARRDGKITVVDDVAKGVIFIAEKIDDVLEGIGWKRVVAPITVAIFAIPKKITAMLSRPSNTSGRFPDAIQQYLPPPMTSLPSGSIVSDDDNDDVIDVEWVEIEKEQSPDESFVNQLFRRMHERIDRIESGRK